MWDTLKLYGIIQGTKSQTKMHPVNEQKGKQFKQGDFPLVAGDSVQKC